jgi:hypothetical protein
LDVEMAFHVVSLVNYTLVRPVLKVVTDADDDYGTAIDDDEIQPDKPTKEGPCDPCG